MKKMKVAIASFILNFGIIVFCSGGTQTISGTLMNGGETDSSYYYVDLGTYNDSSSIQSQVFKAYPTQGGHGIWYDNTSWTLDNNNDGQHITITQDNVNGNIPLNNLVNQTFSFTYLTDSNNVPLCSEFAGTKSWLVVILTPIGNILQSVNGETLHTSVGYSYSYSPADREEDFCNISYNCHSSK